MQTILTTFAQLPVEVRAIILTTLVASSVALSVYLAYSIKPIRKAIVSLCF